MSEAEKIHLFDSWLKESARIVISTHMHPDGDAVGSSCGLASYLKDRGKTVDVVFPDPVPDTLGFAMDPQLKGLTHSVRRDCEKLISEADLLISIDYNRPDRAAELADAIRASKARKVLIDHHLNPDENFYDLIFSTIEISSSCEVLYGILKKLPDIDGNVPAIGASALKLLMLGMTTDTNNFANSTYPSTLQMASELLAAGVDRQEILSGLYNSYRENRFRFMGEYLSDKLTITPYGLAYAVITTEDLERYDIREGETEGFVNMPLGIAEVRMSIFLRQEGNLFRVSVRSKQGVSANRCATMYFNGGGHENASGGRLAIPQDVESAGAAREYIERSCSEFFSKDELWKSK